MERTHVICIIRYWPEISSIAAIRSSLLSEDSGMAGNRIIPCHDIELRLTVSAISPFFRSKGTTSSGNRLKGDGLPRFLDVSPGSSAGSGMST